jgi:hypothetical protein
MGNFWKLKKKWKIFGNSKIMGNFWKLENNGKFLEIEK